MREFQRGAVRLHILHHAAEEEIHGAWMTEELARHGYDISPGTLYPTLHRLEADGLLTSEQRVVDGRTRRVYTATKAGKKALAEDRRALRELAREVLGNDVPAGAEDERSDGVPVGDCAADAVGGGADGQHRSS
ncbi:PadR family transcriptional regulator [Streptomyces sp. NPDC059262]|uniref:PadR family transcriptional regulator n=1 Tax=Streptomyces sp. NPDC059262 TaxID=3346797 RepID=UPI003683E7A6